MYNFNLRADFNKFIATLEATEGWGYENAQIIRVATSQVAAMVNPETGRPYGLPYAFAYMVEFSNNSNDEDWAWIVSLAVVNS